VPKRNGPGIELLADPTRRRIVALLAVHGRRQFQIAAAIGLSRPATSRQLRLLTDAGLIRRTPSPIDGRGVLFGLAPATHGAITAWLAGTGFGGRVGLSIGDDWRVRDG
jgi:DNA-binding transcriptional ArsR family regulator